MISIHKTEKMCFVIITQHRWLFLGHKILLFNSSFRTVAIYKIFDFYIGYIPSVGKSKSEQEISGMCTYFRVVMETRFE